MESSSSPKNLTYWLSLWWHRWLVQLNKNTWPSCGSLHLNFPNNKFLSISRAEDPIYDAWETLYTTYASKKKNKEKLFLI